MEKLHGVESLPVVLHRFSDGVEVVRCVVEFCSEVATLEKSYSESLHRLLRSSSYTFKSNLLFQWLGNDPYKEIGSLKHSWQELGQELCKLADLHSEQAEAYHHSVKKPLIEMLPGLEEARRNMRLEIIKIKASQEQPYKKMKKEKQKYIGLGENCDKLQNQIKSLKSTGVTGVTGKMRLSRMEKKLDSTEKQLHDQEQIYHSAHSQYLAACKQCDEDIGNLYKMHQEREIKRVNALKEALLNFTKTLSNTAPAYLEGMKKIQLSVSKIDANSDIQWFVNEHVTLQTLPTPPLFEKYSFVRDRRGGGEEGEGGGEEGEGEGRENERISPIGCADEETEGDNNLGKDVGEEKEVEREGESPRRKRWSPGNKRTPRMKVLSGFRERWRHNEPTEEEKEKEEVEEEEEEKKEGEKEAEMGGGRGEGEEGGIDGGGGEGGGEGGGGGVGSVEGDRSYLPPLSTRITPPNDLLKTRKDATTETHNMTRSVSGRQEEREHTTTSVRERARKFNSKPPPKPKPRQRRQVEGSSETDSGNERVNNKTERSGERVKAFSGSSGSEGVKFSSLSTSLKLDAPPDNTNPSHGGPQQTNKRPQDQTDKDRKQRNTATTAEVTTTGTPNTQRRKRRARDRDFPNPTTKEMEIDEPAVPKLPELPVFSDTHTHPPPPPPHPHQAHKPPPPTKPFKRDKPDNSGHNGDSGTDEVQVRLKQLSDKATANDYYTIFGVESTASTDEMASVRRELSRRLHPDHFVGQPDEQQRAKEQLMLINEAFHTVLKSFDTRTLYDQLCQFRLHYGRIPDQKQRGLQTAHSKLSSLYKQLKKQDAPFSLLSELTSAIDLIILCQQTHYQSKSQY